MVGAGPVRRTFAGAAALLVAGCAGMQTPLDPAGDQAGALHGLFWLMIAVCGTMYAAVAAGLAWAVARRRRATPTSEAGDGGLERALWVWGVAIIAGLTLLIVGSFLADRTLADARTREALVVRVTGHQWWWRIQYRDPATGRWIETANELHLPLGRTARLELGSADVIHSFWAPNLAGKMDVIPGRANVLDVTPRQVGWFRGQCAEFCGPQHAHMAFDVSVDAPGAFDRWLAAQAAPAATPSELAPEAAVFAGSQCAACHAVRGTSAVARVGPDLTHVGGRRSIAAGTLTMTRGDLQGWIAAPQAIKPGTSMPRVSLSGPDADAIGRYLMALN
jgi:cytochrome c oxidase subunit II